MGQYLFIISLLLFSWQTKQGQSSKPDIGTASKKETKLVIKKEPGLLEHFVDSTNIGKPKKNKFELSLFRNSDSSYVILQFYVKSKQNKWLLKQKFNFSADDISGCFTELSDFNNDGFKDVTYKSAIAARGANEVRRLFIYDNNKDQLIYIKNSENYPNLMYNKKLNCIDAFLVHGGSTTVFLKIEKDSLREFASINLDDKINVQLIDKNGNRRYLIRNKKNTFDLYTRFTNFSPLE